MSYIYFLVITKIVPSGLQPSLLKLDFDIKKTFLDFGILSKTQNFQHSISPLHLSKICVTLDT